jgi:hypothetical protein
VNQIKRFFEEVASYLYHSQTFSHGAVLLTGIGIFPVDDFTLQLELRGLSCLGRASFHFIAIFVENHLSSPF